MFILIAFYFCRETEEYYEVVILKTLMSDIRVITLSPT